ncbi:MAG: hypothetical protein FWG49_02805, partial [Leptospirales bacterium]|nr:hypothetical protein [Leptospirales bacterium]
APSKARHGYIMGSLHEAYIIILNKFNWWNDKTYLKFYFHDDPSKRDINIITKEPRQTLIEIGDNIKQVVEFFKSISNFKTTTKNDRDPYEKPYDEEAKDLNKDSRTKSYSDKLLSTPFGIQYGQKIDEIIKIIFASETYVNSEDIKKIIQSIYYTYKQDADSINSEEARTSSVVAVNYLLHKDYGIKKFAEEFLYNDRKIAFAKFFADNKDEIEEFLITIFIIFFEERFQPIFKIIKSLDMKQYACAFIIKRIYMLQGENLPIFGYFLIKAIARHGKIKVA